MTLVLARIDQRLIHGIVVTQWAGETKAKRLMVVDDVISKDEAQKAAMRMSKPAGTGMSIIDTQTAITNFNTGKYDSHNVFFSRRKRTRKQSALAETFLSVIRTGIPYPEFFFAVLVNQGCLLFQIFNFIQKFQGSSIEILSRLSYGKATIFSQNKAYAEFRLECFDLLRNRRLRNKAAFGSFGEAIALNDAYEVLHLP
jgi:hypothetical protein